MLARRDRAGLDAGAGLLGCVEDLFEPVVNEAALGRDAEQQAGEDRRHREDDEGATMVGALSWTWSHTAFGPRHSPQNVM